MPISRIESNSIAPSQTLTTPIIATTMGVGGATPSGSGSGITFPATQSASTDANTLDDYEEGTFTPTAYGSSTAGTTSYNTQTGKYTKVGRQVTVTIRLGITSMTGTGILTIAGLPFAGEGSDYVGAMMTDGLPYPSSATSINSYQAGVNTLMILWGNYSNGSWATISTDSNCSFITTITYFTA